MGNLIKEYLNRTFTYRRFIKHSLLSFAFAALLSLLALFKGCFVDYLLMLIPTLIVNEIFIFYGCSQNTSGICLNGLCNLNICAAITTAVFEPSGAYIIKVSLFMLIGVLAAALFGFTHRAFAGHNKTIRRFAYWGMLFSLSLCFIMPETNGVSGWFVIGDTRLFQLTEVAKFCYILYLGTLFSSTPGDKGKVITSLAVTAVICVVLMAISELGTVLVICAAYFCFCMLSLEKAKSKFVVVGVYAFLVALVALILFLTANRLNQWQCLECGTVNSGAVVECENSKCKATAFTEPCDGSCTDASKAKDGKQPAKCATCTFKMARGKVVYTCPTCFLNSWDRSLLTRVEADKTKSGKVEYHSFADRCPACQNMSDSSLKILKTCKKAYLRFAMAYSPEKVSDYVDLFHPKQSKKSVQMGRLFGDKDYIVHVPNVTTDSVIAGLVNRLGALFVILVFLVFLQIFAAIGRASAPLRIITTFTFIFQALITYMGTIELLPLTGIGVPLLSRGGTNLVLCYVMIYIMLSSICNTREIRKASKEDNIAKEEETNENS